MKASIFFTIMVALLAATAIGAAFDVTQVQVNPGVGYGISNVIQTPDRIFPGDQVSFSFSFYTTKSGANNVVLTPNAPFLQSSSVSSLNNIQPNAPQTISLTLEIPNDTKPGTYPLYLNVQDANTAQQQLATIQLLINSVTSTNALVAKIVSANMTTGNTGIVILNVTNTGVLDAQDAIIQLQTGNSSTFTAIDTDRQYFDSIGPGQTVSVPFQVGVSAGAAPGYYPLSVTMQYAQDQLSQPTITQQLGVQVKSNADLLLTSGQSANPDGSQTISLTLANIGDTPVRAVYIRASSDSFRIQGSAESFIGTLNLDDSSTVTYSVSPRGGANNNTGTLDVFVSFKDASNQVQSISQSVDLSSPGFGSGTTAVSNRFRRNASGFLGIDLIGWAIIALIVIVGGFFGFRWYKKRKTAKAMTSTGGKK